MKKLIITFAVLTALCLPLTAFADGESHTGGKSCPPETTACSSSTQMPPSTAEQEMKTIADEVLAYLKELFR